jgi:WXXGXW repeat (2 copies)
MVPWGKRFRGVAWPGVARKAPNCDLRREAQEPLPVSAVGGRSMKTLYSSARALAALGAIALLGGCGTEPDSHVVSAPPPPPPTQATVVTTQTTSTPVQTQTVYTQGQPQTQTVYTTQTQPTNTIIVAQAPPAVQAEVVLARPSPDHMWIAGYWTWRDNRYEWMAGHWELPPHSNAVWVAPHWEPENGAYRYYEGYWN